jgi:hypothetical protein
MPSPTETRAAWVPVGSALALLAGSAGKCHGRWRRRVNLSPWPTRTRVHAAADTLLSTNRIECMHSSPTAAENRRAQTQTKTNPTPPPPTPPPQQNNHNPKTHKTHPPPTPPNTHHNTHTPKRTLDDHRSPGVYPGWAAGHGQRGSAAALRRRRTAGAHRGPRIKMPKCYFVQVEANRPRDGLDWLRRVVALKTAHPPGGGRAHPSPPPCGPAIRPCGFAKAFPIAGSG